MSLEKYQSIIANPQARFAVVNSKNEIIKTFQTNKVAKAFSAMNCSMNNKTEVVSITKKRLGKVF